MKILLLTKKFPYPLREGEPIAITYLSRSLAAAGCEITLLAMNTTKHFFNLAALPPEYNHFKAIHTVTVDNRITPGGALKSLLAGEAYILSRFVSKAYEEKLAEILLAEHFDVVQLETLYLAHYIPVIRRHSNAIIAMRAHNVEHEIWQRLAANSPFFLKKWYLLNQNQHLRRFEISRLNDYDLMVAITQRDLEVFRKLGYRKATVVAPVGIDLKDYEPDFQCFEKNPSLAFIGALD
ncbi:MAG: glycosyltransferase, partial [Bacteroidota bacterium]